MTILLLYMRRFFALLSVMCSRPRNEQLYGTACTVYNCTRSRFFWIRSSYAQSQRNDVPRSNARSTERVHRWPVRDEQSGKYNHSNRTVRRSQRPHRARRRRVSYRLQRWASPPMLTASARYTSSYATQANDTHRLLWINWTSLIKPPTDDSHLIITC